jgi:hypothetical protein
MTNTGLAQGLTAGVDEAIDEALGVPQIGRAPHYRHRRTYHWLMRMSPERQATIDFLKLMTRVYIQIEKNWRNGEYRYKRGPGEGNWVLRKCEQYVDDPDQAAETILERRIIQSHPDSWYNQVPVASGLCGSACDKRAAIDLIAEKGQGVYELIELKIKSDHPLRAALEVIVYGLIYIFSRHNPELGYDLTKNPLLSARAIHLKVLAPLKYYRSGSPQWLESGLNRALENFLSGACFTMDFQFQAFPNDLTGLKMRDHDAIRLAMLNRKAIVPTQVEGRIPESVKLVKTTVSHGCRIDGLEASGA